LFFKRHAQKIVPVLIALTLVFIWSNSLAGSKTSNALSGWMERWLKPLLDPHGKIAANAFDYDVRKAAHCIEYAVLGVLLVWVTASMKNANVWLLLFTVLLAAVIDETIQIFTGRTSQVQDIWIDFFGASGGMLLAYGGKRLAQRRSAPRQNKDTQKKE
jgi:VanZ family protein